MKRQNNIFCDTGKQRGVSLIEVMIAVFISAVGLLGAAAMQLNALKYTDSALMTSQANFIAYDIVDRMRANSANLAQYEISNIAAAPSSGSSIRDQDLIDFSNNVQGLTSGEGGIQVNGAQVIVSITWSEARAAGQDANGDSVPGAILVTTNITN